MSSLRRHHSDRTLHLHLHFQHNVAGFVLDSVKDMLENTAKSKSKSNKFVGSKFQVWQSSPDSSTLSVI